MLILLTYYWEIGKNGNKIDETKNIHFYMYFYFVYHHEVDILLLFWYIPKKCIAPFSNVATTEDSYNWKNLLPEANYNHIHKIQLF